MQMSGENESVLGNSFAGCTYRFSQDKVGTEEISIATLGFPICPFSERSALSRRFGSGPQSGSTGQSLPTLSQSASHIFFTSAILLITAIPLAITASVIIDGVTMPKSLALS